MKKAAVLVMAAFYLLLTTGMFVCILHCSAERLGKTPVMAMAKMPGHEHHKKCAHGDDCGCCKKHGEYVVKENIKPGVDYQFSLIAAIVAYPASPAFFAPKPRLINYAWADVKGPPGRSGKSLSIQLHSLQI